MNALTAENLGKKYRLDHQVERQRYTTLRDVVTERARRIFAKPLVRPRPEQFWALKDISFDLKQGEVAGIIGRNGAGKSTLLKILSRITEPTTGRVRLRGRVASLLEVGTGFHPELTGRENVYLNGAILGMTRAEIHRKFDEIVAFADVEKFLDTPVKRYSSGMYVRLAFAVAAHLEPEILIVDEVLAVGDAEFQKKCVGKMQDVSRSGRTVLFVSHNMGAVQSLCGVALLLDRGQLVRVGPVASVIREYLNGQRGIGGAVSQIHLGASLLLDGIHFAPREDHRAPISLSIRVVPKRPTTLRELALLLYSENGVRVSVLDLRRERLLPVALHSDPVEFEVGIDTPRLVEGDYSLGLHVATDEYQDNYLDLASFTVPSLQKRGDFIPYPAGHRGFVELEFSARVLEPGRARRVAS